MREVGQGVGSLGLSARRLISLTPRLALVFHEGVVVVAWAAVAWCERRPGTGRVGCWRWRASCGDASGGWRAAWRDPVGVSTPSASLAGSAA